MIHDINIVNGAFNLNPIPLEFSQTVTTTKWLMCIQSKVNEVVECVNSLDSTLTNTSISYTKQEILRLSELINENINEIESSIESLDNVLNNKIDMTKITLDGNIDVLEKYTNKEINSLHVNILKLFGKFDSFKKELTNLFEYRYNKAIKYIDYKTAKSNGQNLIVENPHRHNNTTLKDCLIDLYKMSNVGRLTCGEIRDININVVDISKIQINNLLYRGRFIFFENLYLLEIENALNRLENEIDVKVNSIKKLFYGFSDISGRKMRLIDIIYELSDTLKNHAMTCQEIADANITVDSIVENSITAYDFGWNLKNIF